MYKDRKFLTLNKGYSLNQNSLNTGKNALFILEFGWDLIKYSLNTGTLNRDFTLIVSVVIRSKIKL
jgi:hypothetical protein